jgi:hypothetical protein
MGRRRIHVASVRFLGPLRVESHLAVDSACREILHNSLKEPPRRAKWSKAVLSLPILRNGPVASSAQQEAVQQKSGPISGAAFQEVKIW